MSDPQEPKCGATSLFNFLIYDFLLNRYTSTTPLTEQDCWKQMQIPTQRQKMMMRG
jgi:hypothetical protein